MKKIIAILFTILLTSCSLQSVSITPLSEKDSIYDLRGSDAYWQGGEVEKEWHRLHSADYNEAAKDLGYFFGYITSIVPENDRLMVTVENYGDNIKSGAYRFPVYDSTPIVKYQMSYMEPADLYVGMMVVILYYDYGADKVDSKVNDVVAYTLRIMNNEQVSSLPEDMEFVMNSSEVVTELPAQSFEGADYIGCRGRAEITQISAKNKELSGKEISKLSPSEFKEWYEGKLTEYLEKNKHVRFYYGYVAYYNKRDDGRTDIVVANKNGTSIYNESFNIRIYDSTVVAKEGKVLKPSDLKVGQKVIIAYYVWDIMESDNSQAVYHVEILDTKDKPDPLPNGVVDIHHGNG